MITGYQADHGGRRQLVQPGARGRALAGEPDLRQVAGDGDVIRRLALQVGHQGGEDLGPVNVPAAPLPGQGAQHPLVEQLAHPRGIRRGQVCIGDVSEGQPAGIRRAGRTMGIVRRVNHGRVGSRSASES